MKGVYRLYTDASGKGNRLGWGFVLKTDEIAVEGSGPGTRGVNQSELIAVLQGLGRVPDGATARVYTDSVYVLQAGRGHRHDFEGFLREKLLGHLQRLDVTFVKVGKGKGSCPDHTRAHHLAREIALVTHHG
jgi:ribonuclease HI